MLSNKRHTVIVRSEVLDVIGAECESIAATIGRDAGRRRDCFDRALHLGTGLRQDGVESEDILNDASDVFELVAKLSFVGVAASIERCTDDDRLWV